ncbi:Mechanosensitive ion channel OS=Streptomyces tendae OX=1932 GN=GUR47_09125 PE=3 SV=1 [Streptomyces tendae]
MPTVRSDEDLDKVKETLTAVGERMSKEEPWNEMLWGPIETLGLDSRSCSTRWWCGSPAKTMPGSSSPSSVSWCWRIKRAFDAAGIAIVGGATVPMEGAPAAADPTAGVAAPSAYASSASPQSMAASPIPPPSTSK